MSRFLFVAGFFLATTVAFGQSSQTDSQTLRDLLAEIRSLRDDVRASTVANQRLQILVYRLQVEQEAVARVLHQVDDAKAKLSDLELRRNGVASRLKRLQDARDSSDNNATAQEVKDLEDSIASAKANLEILQNQEAQAQTIEMQAEEQLRIEQSKVNELEDRLSQQDKELENLTRPLAPGQQK
jgi:chromosome segregation ATPase